MNIPKKLYDTLAFCGRLFLPASAVLCETIGHIYEIPILSTQVPLTVTAVAVFINTILGINSNAYFKEHEIVKKDDEVYDVSRTD